MEINIPETDKKGNSQFIGRVFWPILIVLAGFLAWGAIKITAIESGRRPLSIKYSANAVSSVNSADSSSKASISTSTPILGLYVAARGGKVYYLPSCAGAKRIAEKNKIWFQSREEAERFGYKQAKNCY